VKSEGSSTYAEAARSFGAADWTTGREGEGHNAIVLENYGRRMDRKRTKTTQRTKTKTQPVRRGNREPLATKRKENLEA